MRFLRIIWKDILRLNAIPPPVKIPALILLIALIVGAWYLGAEWWNVKGYLLPGGRLAPRWEILARHLVLPFFGYVLWVIERARKSR